MIYDVVALGELLIDFTENGISAQGNPLFEANPGGAPCNLLAMLSKLGHSCAFIGKVGGDMFGHQLRGALQAAGITSNALLTDPDAPTTLAFVKTAPDGEREFSFLRENGADIRLRADELPADLLQNTRIFHYGSLSMTHEDVREATRQAIALAKESGALLSFDPNLRPALWKSLAAAKAQIAWGLGQCDILKLADNELAFLTGETDLLLGAELLRRQYPNIHLMCVTAGANGSYAFCGNYAVYRDAFRLGGTIDTTGAGDTFGGCVLHHILRHGLDGLDEASLGEMLAFANAAAYLVTTRKGALRSMPNPTAIEAILHQR